MRAEVENTVKQLADDTPDRPLNACGIVSSRNSLHINDTIAELKQVNFSAHKTFIFLHIAPILSSCFCKKRSDIFFIRTFRYIFAASFEGTHSSRVRLKQREIKTLLYRRVRTRPGCGSNKGKLTLSYRRVRTRPVCGSNKETNNFVI